MGSADYPFPHLLLFPAELLDAASRLLSPLQVQFLNALSLVVLQQCDHLLKQSHLALHFLDRLRQGGVVGRRFFEALVMIRGEALVMIWGEAGAEGVVHA